MLLFLLLFGSTHLLAPSSLKAYIPEAYAHLFPLPCTQISFLFSFPTLFSSSPLSWRRAFVDRKGTLSPVWFSVETLCAILPHVSSALRWRSKGTGGVNALEDLSNDLVTSAMPFKQTLIN